MELAQSLQSILLVDDSSDDRQLIIQALKQSFRGVQVEEICNLSELDNALANSAFELVITDSSLHGTTGLEILAKVKALLPDCPMMMLTNSGSEEVAVAAIKAGFDDYVIKSPEQFERLSQIVRAILEKKQTRQQIIQSESRLKVLLNELNMGTFRATPQGELLEASEGFLNLLGFSSLATAPVFFQDSSVLSTIAEVSPRSPPILEWVRPDGQQVWLQVHAMGMPNHGQKVIEGLLCDITDQVQVANALRQRNQTLEQWVEDRTLEIQAISGEMETFAFSISHDLRSPIRQINGFVSLLRQSLEPFPCNAIVFHYLQTTENLADRCRRMIDDLLHFSRTGRVEMQYSTVNMTRLVYEICSLVEMQLRDHEIVWQITNLPEIQGDRNLLRQVWQNLIDNAVKYSYSRPCIEIEIGARSTLDETIFFVRDNGIGFDMQDADRLFSVFQRLPNTTAVDGTGVGLANVQRIVRRHGGRVWAEGEIEGGATFYFSLPHGRSQS
ncbi:MAG: response regulator [Scytolyngbya sp. HA4215-MV1]|jgi:signal transduction histidine kinase|nr:response regulator [Scytolyngbya sp. HA4215-MV1]